MLPRLLRGQARGPWLKRAFYELASWRDLVFSVHALGEEWSQGDLWAPRVRYALVKCNRLFTPSDLGLLEDRTCFRLTTSRSEALF